MFKVNNVVLVSYFTPCSNVSIVNFEHVIAGWVSVSLPSWIILSLSHDTKSHIEKIGHIPYSYEIQNFEIKPTFFSLLDFLQWSESLSDAEDEDVEDEELYLETKRY